MNLFLSYFLSASLLQIPKMGDPSMMRASEPELYYRNGSGGLELYSSYMPGGYASFSFCAWVRSHTNANGWCTSNFSLSAHDARPTDKGGAELHNSGGMGDWTNIVLSSSGSFVCPSAVVSPRSRAQDEYPNDVTDLFNYGVWCLNVVSNSAPITLLLAGTEYQIPVTNFYVRNILGSASDPSLSISGTPWATLRLGIGELIPLKFYTRMNGVKDEGRMFFRDDSIVTNEWALLSFRARIEAGRVITRDDLLKWGENGLKGKILDLGETTAKDFEKGHLMRFGIRGLGLVETDYDLYGMKFYPFWLDDSQIECIRARDEEEMKRRGFKRFYGE